MGKGTSIYLLFMILLILGYIYIGYINDKWMNTYEYWLLLLLISIAIFPLQNLFFYSVHQYCTLTQVLTIFLPFKPLSPWNVPSLSKKKRSGLTQPKSFFLALSPLFLGEITTQKVPQKIPKIWIYKKEPSKFQKILGGLDLVWKIPKLKRHFYFLRFHLLLNTKMT